MDSSSSFGASALSDSLSIQYASAGSSSSSLMRNVPHSSPQWTAPAIEGAIHDQPTPCEHELTYSTSRHTGLPSTVSSASTSSVNNPQVAISSFQPNTYTSTTGQDVRSIVNSSYAQQPLEPTVSSYTTPSQHVINPNSTRPRTSNKVFASPKALATHYGIPLSLPPAPSTQPKRPETTNQSPQQQDFDFLALRANYLNMLAQKNTEPTTSDMSNFTVSPADLQKPLASDFGTDMDDELLQTIESEYLTSPWTPMMDSMEQSPGDTPFSDFLTTPLIADSNVFHDSFGPLFSDSLFDAPVTDKAPESMIQNPAIDMSGLLAMSPPSPNFGTSGMNPANLYSPHNPMDASSFPMPASVAPSTSTSSNASTSQRRRAPATGTRKNLTPDALVPLDAPTQPRHYIAESATSRKEIPASFARKRTHREMLDGEEDELEEPLKPDATQREQIEWKRRQNTIAARKSRKRKLEYQKELETKVSSLTKDVEMWKQRANLLKGILRASGIPYNDWPEDVHSQ